MAARTTDEQVDSYSRLFEWVSEIETRSQLSQNYGKLLAQCDVIMHGLGTFAAPCYDNGATVFAPENQHDAVNPAASLKRKQVMDSMRSSMKRFYPYNGSGVNTNNNISG